MKLCVNLNSAIRKCSAVDPSAIMGETSAELSLAVVGCMGVLQQSSIFFVSRVSE